MQALSSDYSLPLFQSSHAIHTNPCLDEGIQIINNMVELNYITYGSQGLQFTNAGIEYMMKKFQEFCDTTEGQNIDLGVAYALNGNNPNKRKHGLNVPKEFMTSNLLIFTDDNKVDYNNVVLRKCQDEMEPGIDGIDRPK